MNLKQFSTWSALALLAVTTGCTQASPARPTETSAAGTTAVTVDAVTGVTLTAPSPVSPAVNQQFKYSEQPLTLTVKNVARTGTPGQIVYRFEVSTSASFGSLAAVATVNEQGGSTTSTTINANLGNGNYFWRVQASDPSNSVTTSFSGTSPFTVQ